MPLLAGRKKLFFAAVVVWAVLLAFFSLVPHKTLWRLAPSEDLHNLAHLLAYAVLAYFVCFWLRFRRWFFGRHANLVWTAVFGFVLTIVWGGVTELLQLLRTDRYTDFKDWAVDNAGAALGVLLFFFVRKLRKQ